MSWSGRMSSKRTVRIRGFENENSIFVSVDFSPPWFFVIQPPPSSTKVAQIFTVIGVKDVDTRLIIKVEAAVIFGPGQIVMLSLIHI